MSCNRKLFLWKAYNWVCHIIYLILEILPMCIRIFIFKIWLGELGRHTSIIDYGTYFRYPNRIKIGSYVAINRGCTFLAVTGSDRKYDIVIGNHCSFGPKVSLLNGGHDYSQLELPRISNEIVLGDYVWIGAGATILPGVHIGDGG